MCLTAGMDGYITKPFQPAHLTEMLLSLANQNNFLIPRPWQGDDAAPTASLVAPSGPSPSLDAVIAHLQATTSLNAAQIDRVLAAACLSITDNLAKAREALARADHLALGRLALSLKGTLLQCGLNALAEKAEEIHCAVNAGNDLPYDNLMESLNSSLAGMLSKGDINLVLIGGLKEDLAPAKTVLSNIKINS
jgi:hypothetical protein